MLINVGVNDTDVKNAEEITKNFQSIIKQIREKYNGIKIILSEITPRKDDKDSIVIECNNRLAKLYDKQKDIYIINHQNLRDSS